MSDLIARMRKARESVVDIGRFRFTLRRPTAEEAVTLFSQGACAVARHCVVGWSGVVESDVIKGGASEEIPFDRETWCEWIADRPDLWRPLDKAAVDAYAANAKRLEEAEKN